MSAQKVMEVVKSRVAAEKGKADDVMRLLEKIDILLSDLSKLDRRLVWDRNVRRDSVIWLHLPQCRQVLVAEAGIECDTVYFAAGKTIEPSTIHEVEHHLIGWLATCCRANKIYDLGEQV